MGCNTKGSVNEQLRARHTVCEAEEVETTRNAPKMPNIAVMIVLIVLIVRSRAWSCIRVSVMYSKCSESSQKVPQGFVM